LVESNENIFSLVRTTPAVQDLARRVERERVLSLSAVIPAAQPFIVALLHDLFAERPVVAVTAGVRSQETFQQDLATWVTAKSNVQSPKSKVGDAPRSTLHAPPLFYPSWETLPHEPKLPHADVISERLETLVALRQHAALRTPHSALVVTNVLALLQKTFPAGMIAERTRRLERGQRIEPLDLVEWLEDQGYEPEAQVNHKGEIALRGGILDIFPLTSPWPVRLEFFGDELESLREFDPITQMSKEPIESVTLPPCGRTWNSEETRRVELSTLNAPALHSLDYLPANALFVLCDPDALDKAATDYAVQVPEGGCVLRFVGGVSRANRRAWDDDARIV
jgi:transcription-repair coupling factor (superfamily II helicase)